MSKRFENQKAMEEFLEEALVPEEEQLYEIPENWIWTKLGEVIAINPPKMKLSDIDDKQVCSFIPMASVSEKTGRIEEIEERNYEKVKKGYTQFFNDDILFAKITPCMENGKVAIAENLSNGFGYGSTEFYVFRTKKPITKKFVYYFVRSDYFRNHAKGNMTGAVGQQRVPKKYLELYPIALPPIKEQKRITDKVERLLNKIDEAKQLIAEAKETFELRRAAILDKAFRGNLTAKWRRDNTSSEAEINGITNTFNQSKAKHLEKKSEENIEGPYDIPSSWEWAKIGDLFHVQIGSTPSRKKSEYWDGEHPWISSGEVQFNEINHSKEKVTKVGIKESRLKIAPKGSILFAMIGEGKTRGQVAKLNIDAYHNQNIASIWVSETSIESSFVYYWLLFQYLHNRQNSSGNNQPAYNKSRVQALLIPIPPLEEQHIISEYIVNMIGKDNNALLQINTDNEISKLKESILSKAFKGEFGTNNPTEESAVELLKEVIQMPIK
ncbi:restriction endonuclease subunit S [Alkalicoccus saliphilus]|uniref:Type I restriction modification DNA specificity domain-containing protein n=1 Tax=Alkalicoccus saliphilus TaxID=200989 RepID=A0A2T4U3Y4_9BACI|nr:restriction endonuclease subunit S [Alkalicoccus saliphilus]PTL38110.1 hypothetical protein C6Y45_13020 [Alkalicoccus saliphilus]